METIEELFELAQKTGHELSLWTCQGALCFTATREDPSYVESTFEARDDYPVAYRKVARHMRNYLAGMLAVEVKQDGEEAQQVQCAAGDPIRD